MAMVRKKFGDEFQWPQLIRSVTTRSQSTSALCIFSSLPIELFHMILDHLSVLEVSVLSMVSKEMTRHVVDYISSKAWERKNIQVLYYPPSPEVECAARNLGLLFRRCTLLLPTKDRIKFLSSKLSQLTVEKHPCLMLEQCPSPGCNDFSGFGVIFQTLIAGRNELERLRIFDFLCNITNLVQKIQAVLISKPGVKSHQELQLRLFCHQVLLVPWLNQLDTSFWLVQLLKPWPIVSQAYLLLILYGPLLPEGILAWPGLVERALPQSTLWDLAKGICMLFDHPEVKGWTKNSMLTILNELTVIPRPWHMENVARLLAMSGSHLCYAVVASKVLNGQLTEASRLITHLILVSEKDNHHVDWVGKMVQQISKLFSTKPYLLLFIEELENMFSEMTWETFRLALAGNDLENREAFQMVHVLLNSKAHFHTSLLHMLLSRTSTDRK